MAFLCHAGPLAAKGLLHPISIRWPQFPPKLCRESSTKLPTPKFQEVPINAAGQLRHVDITNAMPRKMTHPAINHPHLDLYERHCARRCTSLENKLVTVPAWHLPLFGTANFVSSFFRERRHVSMCMLRMLTAKRSSGLHHR